MFRRAASSAHLKALALAALRRGGGAAVAEPAPIAAAVFQWNHRLFSSDSAGSPAKKRTPKKSVEDSLPAGGSPAKKSPAKKSPAKKSTEDSLPAGGSPAKKSTAKKSPAKKSAEDALPAGGSPAKKRTAKKSRAKKLVEDELLEQFHFGTKENPVVIPSWYDKRIVGCCGGSDYDTEHDAIWFWVEKERPYVCPICTQYFVLKVVGPGGQPEGHLAYHDERRLPPDDAEC